MSRTRYPFWSRLLAAFSLILLGVNAGVGLLVYRGFSEQADRQRMVQRAAHVQALESVLTEGFDAFQTVARLVPRLAPLHTRDPHDMRARVDAALETFAPVIEAGHELKFFTAEELRAPSPTDARRTLLRAAVNANALRSRVVCNLRCEQRIAVPVVDSVGVHGALLMQRPLDERLQRYRQSSGADVAVLSTRIAGDTTEMLVNRLLDATRRQPIADILRSVPASAMPMPAAPAGPTRVHVGDAWFELIDAVLPAVVMGARFVLVDDVTDGIVAAQLKAGEAGLVAVGGFFASELLLILFLMRPMRRLHAIWRVLPRLAAGSYRRLAEQLPVSRRDGTHRDEIDEFVSLVMQIGERMREADDARNATSMALSSHQRMARLVCSMVRVVEFSGQPLSGGFAFGEAVADINRVLSHITTWSEFLAFVHADDRLEVLRAWRGGIPGSRLDVEFRLCINGELLDMQLVGGFEAVGVTRLLTASGILRDVTETRSLQRLLREHSERQEERIAMRTRWVIAQRDRARAEARAHDLFAAGVSHEIRTPMHTVIAVAQVGMRTAREPDTVAMFSEIVAAGEHLIHVVNDVLDFTKMDAGGTSIEHGDFELNAVVAQVMDMVRPQAEAKGLALTQRLADSLERRVVGDSARLRQILINLLVNAIKFTETGSIRIHVYRDSGDYCFRVSDTGIGIRPRDLHHLFRPYYQARSGRATREQGSGLGLAISRKLARRMGGDIRVRSRWGRGSQFELRLPLGLPDAQTPGTVYRLTAEVGERPLDGLHVLLAEDVAINRKAAEHLLRLDGASVETFGDGASVVERLGSAIARHADVVLMDVQMPGMDGREATRRIRAAGRTLPIIGITADASAEGLRLSLAAGMQCQLIKPLLRETLVMRIREHVRTGAGQPSPGEVREPRSGYRV